MVSWAAIEATDSQTWYANDIGLTARNDLDVNLQYLTGSSEIPALVSGESQIAITGGYETMAANRGLDRS